MMRFLFWCLLVLPAVADKLYTDAAAARLGPKAMGRLAALRSAGVTELVVPSWLPGDLRHAAVKSLGVADRRFGPGLELVWPSSRPHHGLELAGASGGFGGPGPSRIVPVQNPTLGKLDLWVSERNIPLARYCTDWIKVVGGMPRERERCYYVRLQCDGQESGALSREEMERILGSLRYLRI